MRFMRAGMWAALVCMWACGTGGATAEQDLGKDKDVTEMVADVAPEAADAADALPEVDLTPTPVCPDKVCQKTENCNTCPDDCGTCCGNKVCEFDLFGETCSTCPEDCGKCLPKCGDGTCDAEGPGGYSEDCGSCAEDCGECPAVCGNGEIETGEECDDGNQEDGDGCDQGCKTEVPACPNGECEPELDETCQSCPDDCGTCCGNGQCEDAFQETCETCWKDCGECCGNGQCEETYDEKCETCPEDCGACPSCGDGVLQLELGEQCDDGNNEPDDGCNELCKIELQLVDPGAVIITEIMKDPDAVDDAAGEWLEIYNATDAAIDINGWKIKDEGTDEHVIFSLGGVVVNAKSFFVLGREADPAANGGAAVDYEYSGFKLANNGDTVILVAGDILVDEVKYDFSSFPHTAGKSMNLSADAFGIETNDLGANWCDAKAPYGDGDWGTPGKPNPNCVALPECGNGILEAPEECDDGNFEPDDGCDEECQKELVCDDGFCDPDGETCDNCPQDCGECPMVCGDGKVTGDEQCDDGNAADCDGCSAACKNQGCGNGTCECAETCLSCPGDCGECCPNGKCDTSLGESCASCQADCGECCPNGKCDADIGETCSDCPADCGPCPSACGNGLVEVAEPCDDGNTTPCDGCSADCKLENCGDGTCSCGEDCAYCPKDCGSCCGDKACVLDHGENCATCPGDCGPCCGNGACEANFSETCVTCLADCGECQPYCGDLLCNGTETCSTCPLDCSPCCGDSVCNGMEKCASCPKDCGACPTCGDKACNGTETCLTCPGDCGACSGWCALSGAQGQTVKCDLMLAAQNAQSPKAASLQLTVNYAAAKAGLAKLLCTGGTGDPVCTATATQHTVSVDPASVAAWAGTVKVALAKTGQPAPITQAYMNGPAVVGEAKFISLTFTLLQSIPAGQPAQVTLTAVTAADATAAPLEAAVQNGTIITSSTGPQVVCGDGKCSGGENCQTCAGDCGGCCGNGQCDVALGETCSACPLDCGSCALCGDKMCNGTETCAGCPGDCGKCPECGDGKCNGVETCYTCEIDCQKCCGNGSCEAPYGEDCAKCPKDCGACPFCGDQSCNGGETCATCEADCGNCCGNGGCDALLGETCQSCPLDCGACCGNGTCDVGFGETCSNCTADCGACPFCGDKTCSPTETCSTCPADCGACPTSDCIVWGNQGSTVTCEVKLAAENASSPKATGMQFNVGADITKVSGLKLHTTGGDIPPGSALPTGQGALVSDQGGGTWKVMIYANFMSPDVPISQAYMSGAAVVGDPKIFDLVFTLAQTVPQANAVTVSFTEMKATDKDGVALKMVRQNGVFVTSKP